jgi:hypothetical protein
MKKNRFIKLNSDTTFKYFWKKSNTKKWYVEIIGEIKGRQEGIIERNIEIAKIY